MFFYYYYYYFVYFCVRSLIVNIRKTICSVPQETNNPKSLLFRSLPQKTRRNSFQIVLKGIRQRKKRSGVNYEGRIFCDPSWPSGPPCVKRISWKEIAPKDQPSVKLRYTRMYLFVIIVINIMSVHDKTERRNKIQ